MATNKLILTHEVNKLGVAGDVVEVKAGYARNYLIPRRLATPWTKGGEAQVEAIRRARKAREVANLDDARALRDAVEAEGVTVTAAASKEGRLFGAVSTKTIADAVAAKGHRIDRRKIQVTDAIKSTGDYTVTVRIHPEVSAKIKVKVVAE